MSVNSENASETSDLWDALEFLFQKYKKIKMKVNDLEKQVLGFWQILHYGSLDEVVAADPSQNRTRAALETIVEKHQEPQPARAGPPAGIDVTWAQVEPPPELDTTMGLIEPPVAEMQVQRPSEQEPVDISDLPTQKLETLSQQARDRASEYETPAKRPRLSSISFAINKSQTGSQPLQVQKEVSERQSRELDKENVPPEAEQQQTPGRGTARSVSTMLQEAGLADLQPPIPEPELVAEPQRQVARRDGSEDTETPLGSLDRTKVSLGDSVQTTDSQRFIRKHWAIEGTMLKILEAIKAGAGPVTVESLTEKGPVIPGHRRVIAARCFSSILKLKQHAFINIVKDPQTLEIRDITLGAKFDEY